MINWFLGQGQEFNVNGHHGYMLIYMQMHSPQIGNILCQLITFPTLPNLSKIKRWIAYQKAELRTPRTLDDWTSDTSHFDPEPNFEPSKHQQKLNCSNKKWLNMEFHIYR